MTEDKSRTDFGIRWGDSHEVRQLAFAPAFDAAVAECGRLQDSIFAQTGVRVPYVMMQRTATLTHSPWTAV